MIYIRTCAYNAEKTLERTIKSVLNQTYQEFEYHILDNGSTDKTREILCEYARRDKRIISYFNHKNRDFMENPDFWNLSRRIPEDSYFCILDADDFYEITFFEEMLQFVTDNQLDMAACGTIFRNGETGVSMGEIVLPENVVIGTPGKLDACLPQIYWNLRQVWGKLYTAKVAKSRYETELPEWWPSYGGDTVNVLECAKKANRFGVYARGLHNYSISMKSTSYRWAADRAVADVILYEKAVDFLEQKCGRVSQENRNFLFLVYCNALHDTLNVLVRSPISLEEQLSVIRDVVSHDVTKQMFAVDSGKGRIEEEKTKLQKEIVDWLKLHEKEYGKDTLENVMAIYSQINPDFPQFVWKEHLEWYLGKMPQVIEKLTLCKYGDAVDFLEEFLVKKEDAPSFAVQLAQTLAALLQRQEAYVLYEKLYIGALIRQGDLQSAEAELAEWEQILPEDDTLVRLRRQLEEKKGRNR
mgnify:CR=1 FL=1